MSIEESMEVRGEKVSAEAVLKYAKELFPDVKKLTPEHLQQAKEKILKNISEEATADDVENWKKSVLDAHPDHAEKIKFKSRDQAKHINAEIPGMDRSFGVYDMESQTGHVLHESFVDFVEKDNVLEAKKLFTAMFEAKIKDKIDAKRKEVAKKLFNHASR